MQELIKESHIIQTSSLPILCDSTYIKGNTNMPLVIFSHGYKGFKDWGAWHLVMDQIAQRGAYVVKFNFSHNGTSIDNPTEFTLLDAFGKNTLSQEQKDLEQVIDHFNAKDLVDKENIIIIGHSRAGGAVVLQGYYNALVTKVIIWAGVCDFKKRFPQRQRFDRWKKDGVFYVKNARTNQELPHYFSYWEDYIKNKEVLNIQKAAQNLKKPTLIIHGDQDLAVDLKEAELLKRWITTSELVIIPQADHVFGSKHPYTQKVLPKDLQLVSKISIDFIFSDL